MKILFVSASPIRQDISIGNTFLNLFDGIENVELTSIYTKSGYPEEKILRAFQITERMLLKGFFGGSAGQEVRGRALPSGGPKVLMQFAKKARWTVFFWLQNLIWDIGNWKTQELHDFLAEISPDVILAPLSDSVYLNKLIQYVQKYSYAKLVVCAWDDNYSFRIGSVSPLRYISRGINRFHMRETVDSAELMYVISHIQKDEYEQAFHRNCDILTKSLDFRADAPCWPAPEGEVRLLYAGNLGAGRWKSLALIAKAVARLREEGYRITLDTYSATPQTKAMERALQTNGCTLHGAVPFAQVQELQRQADVVIHVEGLSLKSRLAVHQSFSTKLVDYFALGKCIFAVGTPDVASVRHLLDNDAAVVAETADKVYEKLKQLLDHPQLLREYGQKAYLCGRRHHDKTAMQTMLMEDLKRIVENR